MVALKAIKATHENQVLILRGEDKLDKVYNDCRLQGREQYKITINTCHM